MAEAVAIARAHAAADPRNTRRAQDLRWALTNLGHVLRDEGDPEGARAAYCEGVGIARGLLARDPGNAAWARDLAGSLFDVARLPSGGAAELTEIVALLDAMAAKHAPTESDTWLLTAARRRLAPG